jgi:hypothetical protein
MIDKEDICAYLEEIVFHLKKFCKGIYNLFTQRKYFMQRLGIVTGYFIMFIYCEGFDFSKITYCNNFLLNVLILLIPSFIIGVLVQGILFFLADLCAEKKLWEDLND